MFFLSFSLAAAHNNIVVNGGFESANDYCIRHLQKNHYCEVASLHGWYFGSAMTGKRVMEVITNYQDSHAAQGSWSLDLNSNDAIQVEQILNTVPQFVYGFSFKLKPNTWCDKHNRRMGGAKTVTVSIGAKTQSFTTDGSAWKTHGFEFEASSAETKLSFKSDTRGWCGPMIDDVQVVPIRSTKTKPPKESPEKPPKELPKLIPPMKAYRKRPRFKLPSGLSWDDLLWLLFSRDGMRHDVH